MAAVAYNPFDPLEQTFLSALGLGETGGAANSATMGVGGADLSGSSTDQYGFPQWNGFGNSHAAGTWQFQPGTWDAIAQEYGLNFAHPGDQAEGAWQLAQQADPTLHDDLEAGNFAKIQAALKSIWPSVTGNGASPGGLANNLASTIPSGSSSAADPSNSNLSGWQQSVHNFLIGNTGATATDGKTNPVQTLLGAGGNPTMQISLIVVGSVVVFVALWMLLSSQGVVPGPKAAVESL